MTCPTCLRPMATEADELTYQAIQSGAEKPDDWPNEDADHLCWRSNGGRAWCEPPEWWAAVTPLEVQELRAEIDGLHRLLQETLFAGPLVTGRTEDGLRVRDRLLGWVFTSFAAELERSDAPNNLSISMTPDEDHQFAGYRLNLSITRPGCLSAYEQRDEARKEIDRLTPRWRDGEPPAGAHVLRRTDTNPRGYIVVETLTDEERADYEGEGVCYWDDEAGAVAWGTARWSPIVRPA